MSAALDWDRLAERAAALAGPLQRRYWWLTAEDAEDCCAEALARAWQRRDRLRPAGAEGWLATVAGRLAIDLGRRRARHQARPPEVAPALDRPDPAPGPAARAERAETAAAIRAVLAGLPAGQRQALVEVYLREQPRAVVAARLGLPEGTLAVWLWRGRQRFRERWQRAARAPA